MTQSINGDLDAILKRLLEDPLQFDNVKRSLQTRLNESGRFFADQRRASRRDDDDDLFDNVPV
jgi:hypothetical protein